MEYLHHTILIVFWFGIIPLSLTTATVAAIRTCYHYPIRTPDGWRICIGVGLLATGAINIGIALLIGGSLLVVATGWWMPPTELGIGDYTAPIGTAVNTLWCAVLLWLLRPELRSEPHR